MMLDPAHLVLGACLAGCTAPAENESADTLFEQLEIVIGPAARQTVLTGFLLGGGIADLAVVHVDENGDRRLRIFVAGDGTWVPGPHATLRPGVLFVDVANIAGRDRLIAYERGRLDWFDPESATATTLVAAHCSFDPTREGEVPHVDVTRDVNRDGRDDLVVPDVDGFRVFIQMTDGAFADPVLIGPAPEMERIRGAQGYRYDPWSQSRIHEIDFDLDGRGDLVSWNRDHFEVHLQDEQGLFAPEARTFTTDVAFDSDRLSSLATGELTGRVLHSLADLNGDGVADLGILSLQGKSIDVKRSSYEVHFGAQTAGGGIAFAPVVDLTFRSEGGILLGMDRHDLDGDGQVELMFTSIDLDFLESSAWKRLKGFMGDDVWLALEFYRMEGGRYPDTPSTTRRLALDGVPSHREPGSVSPEIVLRGGTHESRLTDESWPRAFNTTLLIGDVSGDGRSDLLIGDHPRILNVFVGEPGPGLFARRPHEVAVAVPNDEEYTWLVDLDRDGRQDILMHRRFILRDGHGAPQRPAGTESQRVTLLIAR